MTLAQGRISKGQCPNDGKEAAPYRLCYDCRQMGRLTRALKRGERLGVFKRMDGASRVTKKSLWFLGDKRDDAAARREMNKWQTPFHLPENDRRGQPKLHGSRVDVDATLLKVIEFIGRPCTEQEIVEAWGRLRSRRNAPLASDLATIIKAADKRKAKNARRAAAWEKSQQSQAPQ